MLLLLRACLQQLSGDAPHWKMRFQGRMVSCKLAHQGNQWYSLSVAPDVSLLLFLLNEYDQTQRESRGLCLCLCLEMSQKGTEWLFGCW